MEPRNLDIHIKLVLYKFRTTFDLLKKKIAHLQSTHLKIIPRHANKSGSRMAQVQTVLTHAEEIKPT